MPAPSPARRLIVTLMAPVPWALLLIQLVLIVPRYSKLFADFGLKVPVLTQVCIDAALWVRTYLVIAFLATLALMGASAGTAYWAQSTRMSSARRVTLLLVVFGLPTGLFILAWVGMLIPQRRLAEGFAK